MTPEEVLSHPPRVFSQAQRESYFENGYLSVERFVDGEWLERLRRIAVEFKVTDFHREGAKIPHGLMEERAARTERARARCRSGLSMEIAGARSGMKQPPRSPFEPMLPSLRRAFRTGTRIGGGLALSVLAMHLAGCTGLIPGLPG